MIAARVIVVPGLAVRTYAVAAAEAVAARGHRVDLLRAPSWRRAPSDLTGYGRVLAESLAVRDERVDLLVGLSVGTQAAAVAAAAAGSRVRRLLLVSPTVDPVRRTRLKLLTSWLRGDPDDDAPGFIRQLPDWAHATPLRIFRGFDSAVRGDIASTLARVEAETTIVHAEHDSLGRRSWAESLARHAGARFVERPGAPHSWPVGDEDGFVGLVEEIVG